MMDSVGIRDRDTRKGAVSPVQNETICGQPHPTVPSTPPHGPLKLPAGPKMRTAENDMNKLNKLAHGVVLVLFGAACWFVWALLQLPSMVRVHGVALQLPAFTRLCM